MTHALFIPSAPSTGAHPKQARGALRRLARLAVAVAIVGLTGCGLFSTEHRVIGMASLDHSGWPLPQIPETATAGVPLEVVITTGGGGCHRQGDTEVEVNGRSAVLTPYDFLTTGYAVCTDILVFFEHKAKVVFEEPGTAEVVLVYSTDGSSPESHKGDGRKVYSVQVAEAG